MRRSSDSIQHRHRGNLTPHGPAHLTNRRQRFPSSTCVCDCGELPVYRPDEEDNDAALSSDSVSSATSRRSGNFHGRSVCACLLARLLRRVADSLPVSRSLRRSRPGSRVVCNDYSRATTGRVGDAGRAGDPEAEDDKTTAAFEWVADRRRRGGQHERGRNVVRERNLRVAELNERRVGGTIAIAVGRARARAVHDERRALAAEARRLWLASASRSRETASCSTRAREKWPPTAQSSRSGSCASKSTARSASGVPPPLSPARSATEPTADRSTK